MQIGGTKTFWGVKRLSDVVMCFVLLPLLVLCAAVLCLVNPWLNPGPLVFRQRRVGQGNRPFVMYKFRTMRAAAGPASFADAETHRINRFGHMLRRFRIDELPQILNVLMGEMSLIGPRPEQPEFVRDYVRTLPGYPLRHTVRPGLSGLSQVVQGYASDTNAARQKLVHDLHYITHSGYQMEGYILWRTCITVLSGFGAR